MLCSLEHEHGHTSHVANTLRGGPSPAETTFPRIICPDLASTLKDN
jgi:hypothetical protein